MNVVKPSVMIPYPGVRRKKKGGKERKGDGVKNVEKKRETKMDR